MKRLWLSRVGQWTAVASLAVGIGCASRPLYMVKATGQVGGDNVTLAAVGGSPAELVHRIALEPDPIFTDKGLTGVEVLPGDGHPRLKLTLDNDGRIRLEFYSAGAPGRSIVMFLNNVPRGVAVVPGLMKDGTIVFEGDWTMEEAQKLAAELNRLAARRARHPYL